MASIPFSSTPPQLGFHIQPTSDGENHLPTYQMADVSYSGKSIATVTYLQVKGIRQEFTLNAVQEAHGTLTLCTPQPAYALDIHSGALDGIAVWDKQETNNPLHVVTFLVPLRPEVSQNPAYIIHDALGKAKLKVGDLNGYHDAYYTRLLKDYHVISVDFTPGVPPQLVVYTSIEDYRGTLT